MKTGIYIRVSTEEQVNEGYSIDAQREKLLQYCTIQDYEVIDIYIDEGISGKSLDRPRVKQLIEDVKQRKLNNVLVFKLDRITRSLKDLIMLVDLFEKYQVHFTSFTEKIDTSSSSGRMFLQLMGVLAEWERNVIGERVVVGMEQRALEGKFTAPGNPFGYIYEDGIYKVNEEEAEIIKEIFTLYQENKGYTAIAKHLNSLGYRTKNHSVWLSKTIWLIIKRPYYAGYFYYKKDQNLIKANNINPIISLEVWKACQKKMESSLFNTSKKYSRDDFLFHKILRCSCGRLMRTNIAKSKNKNKLYFYYSCPLKKEGLCQQGYISIDKVERKFVECINKVIPDNLRYIVSLNSEEIQKKQFLLTYQLSLLKKEEERKNKLQLYFLDEDIDKKSYEVLLSKIENRIDEIQKQVDKTNEEIKNIDQLTTNEEILLEVDFMKQWEELSLTEKKDFVRRYIKKIVIENNNLIEIEFNN